MSNFKTLSAKEKAKQIMLVALYPLIMLYAQLGKVFKLFATKKRQIIASILSVVMIITMLPAMSLTAFASTPTPLTFTAEEDNSTVTFSYNSGSNVMYKLNSADWTAYSLETTITLDSVGDTVSFKGINVVTDYYNHFEMTGKIAGSGDVTSLTNGVGGDVALNESCYYIMFGGCTSLTTAPELPATTLADYCYLCMFYGCTGLSTPPELPATTLTQYCYDSMFQECTGIKVSQTKTGNYIKEWRIPTTEDATTAYSWNTSMLANTTGTFTDDPAENTTYYLYVESNPLTFTAEENNSSVTFSYSSGSDVMYKTSSIDWTACSSGTTITLDSVGDTVSFKGTNVVTDNNSNFAMTGKVAGSGDVTSLTNGIGGDATLTANCYSFMFACCTGLTTAPKLPATTLAEYCYRGIFYGCTGLTVAPELPATTLADYCYANMFEDCTGLTTAPELTATTLTDSCYSSMFSGCTGLTTPPELPATTLADSCYSSMFSCCTGLTTPPELPATTLAQYCYSSMFEGCTGLTIAPELPASTLTDYCYSLMFYCCTGLTTPPELPATTLAQYCYYGMFCGCTNLKVSETQTGNYTKEWRIPTTGDATTASSWNGYMFNGTGGTFTSEPAVNTTYYIYHEEPNYLTFTAEENNSSVTFSYDTGSDVMYKTNSEDWTTCSSGTTINLDSVGDTVSFKGTDVTTDLDNHFAMTGKVAASGDVTSLTNGFGGDAILTDLCYVYMFYDCESLTTAPELPSTSLANGCYYYMFDKCTGLTVAPELPATTLADYCYANMFEGCTGLTVAPELPASTLTQYCYSFMFSGCTGLTTPPELPATTLAQFCYYGMFSGCTNLKVSETQTGNYTKEWRIPTTGEISTTADSWNGYMLDGTGGTFTIDPAVNTTYYIYHEEPNYLTFTAEEDNSSVTFSYDSGSDVMYKTSSTDWTSCSSGTTITLDSVGDTVSFKGTNVTTDYDNHFSMTGKVAGSGDVTSLTNEVGGDATLTDYCYYSMFYGCTSLTTAPVFPATTLAENCYYAMFYGCTGLTVAPELPATTMAECCYNSMFYGCTGLTTAPELPATTLADYCYYYMFFGCRSLKVSKTQTGDYTKEWRIPTTGDATTASSWNKYMLDGTGGTFTDEPEMGITYYILDDKTAPVITGIEDGKTYCETLEFTVADDSSITVTANGTTLTPSDGKYTLTTAGTYTVVATDKGGYSATTTVTINADHTWKTEWSSDGTNHWHECSVCGEKKDKATHTPNADDGDCTTEICCSVCGAVTTAAKSHDFSGDYDGHDNTQHWHICNNEGCTATDEKVSHSGGAATYFDKAVCEDCGQAYGNTTPDVTAPTNLKIKYNNNGFRSFLNTITFGVFFKETVTVTASAEDSESGVASYKYFASDKEINDFSSVSWQNSLSLSPNSKKIVYVKATDNAGNESIVNYEGVVVYSNSSVSPNTATFDKNVDEQADVDFTMTLNDNTLKDIKNGSTVLTSGTDYTVSGTTVTVKKAYFAAQENGNVTLTFSFYPMGVENNDNLSTSTATVTVSDTTHYHSMSHTAAVAPTCTTDGNVEYWYCSGCNKYFSDEDGDTEITIANTVSNALGHSFTSYVYNNDATYEENGTETATCDRCDATDVRTAAGSMLIDTTAPTGEIKINSNSFKDFVNSISFGLFFKESQTVTITGSDAGIGMDKIYYYKSETALSLDQVKALSSDQWTVYSTLTLTPDWQGVVYGKLTDKSGNTLYISSDGLVLDATSPVIAGVTDGSEYCNTATVQVTEANLDSVTLGGETVTLQDGKFTVSAKDSAQKIVVTDKAGNVTSATITVYDEHIWNDGVVTKEPTVTENGVKTYTCNICGETKTEAIDKLAPSIIEGENGTYKQGDKNGLTFKSNASLADFISVSVDGKVIDNTNYTLKEGSTIVTLKADYLETLSVGKHTLEINSNSGTAYTEFTIEGKTASSVKENNNSKPGDKESPQTGDASDIIMWLALLFVSGGALTTLGLTKKRKKPTTK